MLAVSFILRAAEIPASTPVQWRLIHFACITHSIKNLRQQSVLEAVFLLLWIIHIHCQHYSILFQYNTFYWNSALRAVHSEACGFPRLTSDSSTSPHLPHTTIEEWLLSPISAQQVTYIAYFQDIHLHLQDLLSFFLIRLIYLSNM